MNSIFYNGEKVTIVREENKKGSKRWVVFENGNRVSAYKKRVDISCVECGRLTNTRIHPGIIDRLFICMSCQSRKNNIGRKHSPESIEKIKKNHRGCSGQKNPFYGKHHTKETRKKISIALIGKMAGDKNPFYGKSHTEKTKRRLSETTIKYNDSLNAEQKARASEKVSNGLIRFQNEHPEYTKRIRRKAAIASLKSQKHYKINRIETAVKDQLLQMGIDMEYSVILGDNQYDFGSKKYRILLEVHGDYWHANPITQIKRKRLTEAQKIKAKKDIKKKQFALRHGFKLFVIWEHDINHANFSVLEDIKRYINEIDSNK